MAWIGLVGRRWEFLGVSALSLAGLLIAPRVAEPAFGSPSGLTDRIEAVLGGALLLLALLGLMTWADRRCDAVTRRRMYLHFAGAFALQGLFIALADAMAGAQPLSPRELAALSVAAWALSFVLAYAVGVRRHRAS